MGNGARRLVLYGGLRGCAIRMSVSLCDVIRLEEHRVSLVSCL